MFTENAILYKAFKTEIDAYFKTTGQHKKANKIWFYKAWSLIAIYMLTYVLLLLFGNSTEVLYCCYALLGILVILLGLNIGHDATHKTISQKNRINMNYARIFDFLGGSSYIWRIRHIYAHHPFPNIIGYDSDLKQSKLVRFFPQDRYYWFHKYQHIYTPILIILSYTLNWLLIRDFKDFRTYQFGKKRIDKHGKKKFLKMLGYKAFYIFYIFIVPIVLGFPFWKVVLGFLIMNVFAGIIISIALISTHVGDYHDFPIPDANGNLDRSFIEHQLATTSDFCTKVKIFNVLFGGFNHHVTHHLFPDINHVHYPNLTPIVRRTAEKYGLKYHTEENIYSVFQSHIRLLKREGFHYAQLESGDF